VGSPGEESRACGANVDKAAPGRPIEGLTAMPLPMPSTRVPTTCLRLLPLLLVLALPGGCRGGATSDPGAASSGSLEAQFTPMPNPPTVGHDSAFAVTLTDSGVPVSGASVHLALFFKSMNQAGPDAMCSEVAPGRYEATGLSTGMHGRWEAEVSVTRAGQPDARFNFPFSVAR
jgi:hypothetical protein